VTLARLEAELLALPTSATKHDLAYGFERLAEWLRERTMDEREAVFADLPTWLRDRGHPWHWRAALELAVALGNRPLLDAAVHEAVRLGIHRLRRGQMYPHWMSFQLHLISALHVWRGETGPIARQYLRRRRDGAASTTSYPARVLGIHAWLTECAQAPHDEREACVSDALTVLRSWGDADLLRANVGLLDLYFRGDAAGRRLLARVLTAEERRFIPRRFSS